MRRKKIENYLFNFLKWLPFFVLGVYSLIKIMYCINHDVTFDVSSYFYDFQLILVGGDSTFVWNQVCQAVFDFGELIGAPSVYFGCFAVLFIYWVSVELLHILYDFVIFVPRAIRSIIEKGM